MSEAKQETTAKGRFFQLGRIVATKAIHALMMEGRLNGMSLLRRHVSGDWGDLCEEDCELNEKAIGGEGRVFSSYDTEHGKIFIITEWDRSVTTILFASEY